MRVAQIGNFDPPHSTENELKKALEANGCVVTPYQEGNIDHWHSLIGALDESWEDAPGGGFDFVVWTRTASELNKVPDGIQNRMADAAKSADVPVVGYHLDIWWDLPRQREMRTVPYFKLVDFFCSADGGHEKEFANAGINHRWFPPGVSEFECGKGKFDPQFAAPLGFVGCWDGSYHKEWQHRFSLVAHLKRKNARFWPELGQHAVRGAPLRDLYASVDVLVGDACLVGSEGHYWSDRVPETLGRGGVLIHPRVAGMEDHFEYGKEIEVWDIGDWDALDGLIADLQNDPARRAELSEAGMKRVLKDHTYTVRMAQLMEMLRTEGRL